MPSRAKQGRKESPYSVHPGVTMVQTAIANLKQKSGRTLEEWIRFIKESGPRTEKERRERLRAEHKLGTNYAGWLAGWAQGKGREDGDPSAYLTAAEAYVETMFSGPKAGLRPLYERLLRLGKGLGKDVRVCPCKTIVPLYRRHVFAQIKPTTRSRIDLGLALAKAKPRGRRLVETGGLAKGDWITHRIPITTLAEIDDEVRRWMKTAYALDG